MAERGYVYFVQAVGTTRIKIGKTKNIEKRLRDFRQQQQPFPLRLLRVESVDDMHAVERAYHVHYAACRVHQEWFELPPEVLEQLPTPAAVVAALPPPRPPSRHQRQKPQLFPVVPGNLPQLRKILQSEGYEGAEANPHRVLAKMHRKMLWLLMENERFSRAVLVENHGYDAVDTAWEPYVLDEMIRLGRVQECTIDGDVVCEIVPEFLPRSWQIAPWIDDYIRLIASPKTYNTPLDEITRHQLRAQAQRRYAS
jgi:hypothetical protein